MLADDGQYSVEDNTDFEEKMGQHARELRFRIECMWRRHSEYMDHPSGKKLASKLETDILICESHLRRLECNDIGLLT
jgi:hypothetical protein